MINYKRKMRIFYLLLVLSVVLLISSSAIVELIYLSSIVLAVSIILLSVTKTGQRIITNTYSSRWFIFFNIRLAVNFFAPFFLYLIFVTMLGGGNNLEYIISLSFLTFLLLLFIGLFLLLCSVIPSLIVIKRYKHKKLNKPPQN